MIISFCRVNPLSIFSHAFEERRFEYAKILILKYAISPRLEAIGDRSS
jgi:hypothetical protein